MKLYIVTHQNEIISIDAEPSDSILRLQALVLQYQCLELNNLILDSNKTVQSYNIAPNSLLHLRIKPQEQFTLHVRIFNGRTFTVRAKRTNTLLYVKQQIQQQDPNISAQQQLLFHMGLLLDGDDRPLQTFQINNDCLLDLGYKPPSAASTTHLQGNTIHQQHQPTNGQSTVYQQPQQPQVSSRPDIPYMPTHEKVKSSHSAPKASTTTAASHSVPKVVTVPPPPNPVVRQIPTTIASPPRKGITPTTTASPPRKGITPPATNPHQNIIVNVVCHTNKIAIAINTNDKISVLKEKVFKHTNIATIVQSLTFNGIRLNDDSSISAYGIGNEATIDMFARPPRPSAKRKVPPSLPSSSSATASSSAKSSSYSSATPSLTKPSSTSSTTASGFVSVKKEEQPPSGGLSRLGSFANGVIIDLLSSDDEEDNAPPPVKARAIEPEPSRVIETTSSTKQPLAIEPSPQKPSPQEPAPTRRINLRVIHTGKMQVLHLPRSPTTTVQDIFAAYERDTGEATRGKDKRWIVFGGVPLDEDVLLDDLHIDNNTLLNLM